jgi:sec-independent protein translocase protein TatA
MKKMPTIGFTELLIILIVIVILFGPTAIPKISKAIGEGMQEFKKAQSGENNDSHNEK